MSGLPDFNLQTVRMTLRPMNAGDRDEWLRVHRVSNEFFSPWSPTMAASDTLEILFDKQLKRTIDGMASGRDLRLAGFVDDRRLAGVFSLNEIVRGAFQNAYAGWRVNVELARQGYGAEGVLALVEQVAFAPEPRGLGLHRVQANIIPTNIPSIRLAEKCGFVREGLARRYLQIAGIWQDHLMYARLAE